MGIAVDVTLYGYPDTLEDAYGTSPASVHLFARLRWTAGESTHAHHGASAHG